tara:strand:- start:617 stop:1075 length:459 start_codon:yes stop_codon:yes gene_type:complete
MQDRAIETKNQFTIEVAALPYRYDADMQIDFGITQNQDKELEIPFHVLQNGEGTDDAIDIITDRYISESRSKEAVCLNKRLCCILDANNNENPAQDYSDRVLLVYRLDFRGDQNFNSSLIWKTPVEMADLTFEQKFSRDHANAAEWVIRSNG